MHEYKRILVIRFSSLGDIVLTSSFLKTLRNKFPGSEIVYCTKPQYADAVRFNPNINRIIETDDNLNLGSLKKLKKQLVNERFNLIIDLHNNLKTFYLKLFLRFKSEIFVFRKYSVRKFLLVKFKINLMKNLPPISARYIKTLDKITGLTENDFRAYPEIFTGSISKESMERILAENGINDLTNLICIVPGSRHFTKTYPAEYYAEIINLTKDKFNFALAGTQSDRHTIETIVSKTGKNVYNLCGKLSFHELAELMKICKSVITGDTGPMHIADALNVPLITLMGSSVSEFGFYPQSENSSVIENVNLSCRPCSHIGKEKCPKGHFKCMKEIKPEAVYYKLKEKLPSNI